MAGALRCPPGPRSTRALVSGFVTDRRRLVLGIGPAGAGKTTAMRAVAETWRSTGHRVIPLAPSAAAAEVLGDEFGCRAENLHKFRHAHEHDQRARHEDWFTIQPGELEIVDESGRVKVGIESDRGSCARCPGRRGL